MSVMVIAVLVLALSLHVINRPGLKVANPLNQASLGITNEQAPASINTPIYVIGPQSLTQELISIGINQSLIKPVLINQLTSLPNNSIVIIDWPAIKPLLHLINRTGGVNTASPAVNTLVNLLNRGDLVLISVNRSSLPIAELVLSYSLARAGGVEVGGFTSVNSFPYPVSQYLIAYPVMSVTTNYTLIAGFVYRRDYVTALIVGPLSLHDLPGLVTAWLMASVDMAWS